MHCRYTGATVHFVDEKYDTGPILAQRVVPVRVDDSPAELAARVLKEVRADLFILDVVAVRLFFATSFLESAVFAI